LKNKIIKFHGLKFKEIADVEIPSGGMGSILLIEEISSKVKFVFKSPLEERLDYFKYISYNDFNNDPRYKNFRDEVLTHIKLIHDNIIDFYGFEILDGIPRILLKYQEGGTLKEWIDNEQTITFQIIIDFLIQIAEGMNFTHINGIIHRDLKPENILISENQVVKIADFGIAKLSINEKVWKNMNEIKQDSVEEIGSYFAGTYGYASPEQIITNHISHKTDVFSFGVIGYIMCLLLIKSAKNSEMDLYEFPNKLASISKDFHQSIQTNDPSKSEFLSAMRDCITNYKLKLKQKLSINGSNIVFDILFKCLESDPDNRESFDTISKNLQEIYTQITSKKYIKKKELSVLSQDLLKYTLRGQSLKVLGDPDNANIFFEEALKIPPDDVETLHNRGVVFNAMENYREAIKCYDQVIKFNNKNTHAWFNKGSCLEKLEDISNAIKCYDEVIKNDMRYPDAWFNKGTIMKNLKRYKEAIMCFEKALDVDPWYIESMINKGAIFGEIGDYWKALIYFYESLVINPKFVRSYYNIGVTYDELKNFDKAIKFYDYVLILDPRHFKALYNKALILENSGKSDKALGCYNQLTKIGRKYIENRSNGELQYTDVLSHKGNILKNNGKPLEAIKCYDEIIEIDPKYTKAYFNKGVSLECLGKFTEALDSYDAALKIEPRYYKPLYNKAVIYYFYEQLEKSLKCYESALEIEPKLIDLWINKSQVLDKLQRFDEALVSIEKALEIDQHDRDCLFHKGMILENLKRFDEALVCYDKALNLYPSDHAILYKKVSLLICIEKDSDGF